MVRILPILLLFGLLAISALLGFPGDYYGDDEWMGSGTRIFGFMLALDFIVALATDPLGNIGGAAAFAIIGLGLALQIFVRDAASRKVSIPEADPLLDTLIENVRRRPLVASDTKPVSGGQARASGNAEQVAALLAANIAARPEHGGTGQPAKPGPADEIDALALIEKIIEDNAPPPPSEGPLPPAIEAARLKPILFRQSLPGGPEDGLSFYGGKPFGPAGFVWPRGKGSEGPPLSFIMQWDCEQLAPLDATGLMPKDGVLYCFLNLDWGNNEEFIEGHHFVHHARSTDGWGPVEPPADLGPLYGKEGAWQIAWASNEVDEAERHVPRLLPRFPFTPVAIDYPMPELDPEEGERLFWAQKWIADAQFAAQHPDTENHEVRDIDAPRPEFERPFPAFPHDYGAIRVLAVAMVEKTDKSSRMMKKYMWKDLPEEERQARFDAWQAEAKELYLFACEKPLGANVPQELADQVWEWQAARNAFVRGIFDGMVDTCVDLSIGIGSKGLASVPQEWIDKAMARHKFASDYMSDEKPDYSPGGGGFEAWQEKKAAGLIKRERTVHAPTPNHMFGPPSFVQGYVEEYLDTHILLLELTGYDGPEHHFGEGVLQYLITPEDLEAGRFDKVVSVLSGY